jgi:hypothetical protein
VIGWQIVGSVAFAALTMTAGLLLRRHVSREAAQASIPPCPDPSLHEALGSFWAGALGKAEER